MTTYRLTPWGFTMHRKGEQIGCGVGVTLAQHLGRALSKMEARILRRRGFVIIYPAP